MNMGRNKYLMYVDNSKEYTQKGYGMHFFFLLYANFSLCHYTSNLLPTPMLWLLHSIKLLTHAL